MVPCRRSQSRPEGRADPKRCFDEVGLQVFAVGFQPRGLRGRISGQPPTAAHPVDADGEHGQVSIGVEIQAEEALVDQPNSTLLMPRKAKDAGLRSGSSQSRLRMRFDSDIGGYVTIRR